MHRFHPEENDLIKLTVGLEAELGHFAVVLLETDPETQKKRIAVTPGNVAPTLYTSEDKRTACILDHRSLKPTLRSELNLIAANQFYHHPEIDEMINILEFVTLPTDNSKALSEQFDEIKNIETHLIRYLLKKINHDDSNPRLISVKNWINNYNKHNPKSPLTPTSESENMYIVLNHSTNELISIMDDQFAQNDLPESKSFKKPSRKIQKKLIHNVQYNFVMALGEKMATLLLDIYNMDNMTTPWITRVEELKSQLEEETNQREIEQLTQYIALFQKSFLSLTEKLNILKLAEYNAERACAYLFHRDHESKSSEYSPSRELNKLQGFFFLLSMRSLTETSNIYLTNIETSKNKYIFFLKTNLSDLIHSLSAHDKKLLADIHETWNPDEKRQLLSIIAGSYEALDVTFDNNITLSQIIESALGWRTDSPRLCDQLPNSPTKHFDPPGVPPGMHRKQETEPKKQLTPERRVLLEYRYPESETLELVKVHLEKILHFTALCKTTHLYKKELALLTPQQLYEIIQKPDIPINEKAQLLHRVKHRRPKLYEELHTSHPHEVQRITRYADQALQTAKDRQVHFAKVDKNVARAIDQFYTLTEFPPKESKEYNELTANLKKLLFHENPDETLKHINFMFCQCEGLDTIHDFIKEPLNNLLAEWYTETMISLFSLPLKEGDLKQLDYLAKRYYLTNQILIVVEFFNYLKLFKDQPNGYIQVSLKNDEGILSLDYTLSPDFIRKMKENNKPTLLNQACMNGLAHLIPILIENQAQATTDDLIQAYDAEILSKDLADLLIKAGADAQEFFMYVAYHDDNSLDHLWYITQLLGESTLEASIQKFTPSEEKDERCKIGLGKLKQLKSALQSESPKSLSPNATRLSHSVLYPKESPEPASPVVTVHTQPPPSPKSQQKQT